MSDKIIPKWAEIAHAWANGEKIQFKAEKDNVWLDWISPHCPTFFDSMCYRVKPDTEMVVYARLSPTQPQSIWSKFPYSEDNIKAVFDVETGKLLKVEVL